MVKDTEKIKLKDPGEVIESSMTSYDELMKFLEAKDTNK